ncbi:hypothetical protein HK101_001110 [Irineochytrium annulatum]|nr:hypothetical protein HK101_001110 [Irineochytrium annulatum]
MSGDPSTDRDAVERIVGRPVKEVVTTVARGAMLLNAVEDFISARREAVRVSIQRDAVHESPFVNQMHMIAEGFNAKVGDTIGADARRTSETKGQRFCAVGDLHHHYTKETTKHGAPLKRFTKEVKEVRESLAGAAGMIPHERNAKKLLESIEAFQVIAETILPEWLCACVGKHVRDIVFPDRDHSRPVAATGLLDALKQLVSKLGKVHHPGCRSDASVSLLLMSGSAPAATDTEEAAEQVADKAVADPGVGSSKGVANVSVEAKATEPEKQLRSRRYRPRSTDVDEEEILADAGPSKKKQRKGGSKGKGKAKAAAEVEEEEDELEGNVRLENERLAAQVVELTRLLESQGAKDGDKGKAPSGSKAAAEAVRQRDQDEKGTAATTSVGNAENAPRTASGSSKVPSGASSHPAPTTSAIQTAVTTVAASTQDTPAMVAMTAGPSVAAAGADKAASEVEAFQDRSLADVMAQVYKDGLSQKEVDALIRDRKAAVQTRLAQLNDDNVAGNDFVTTAFFIAEGFHVGTLGDVLRRDALKTVETAGQHYFAILMGLAWLHLKGHRDLLFFTMMAPSKVNGRPTKRFSNEVKLAREKLAGAAGRREDERNAKVLVDSITRFCVIAVSYLPNWPFALPAPFKDQPARTIRQWLDHGFVNESDKLYKFCTILAAHVRGITHPEAAQNRQVSPTCFSEAVNRILDRLGNAHPDCTSDAAVVTLLTRVQQTPAPAPVTQDTAAGEAIGDDADKGKGNDASNHQNVMEMPKPQARLRKRPEPKSSQEAKEQWAVGPPKKKRRLRKGGGKSATAPEEVEGDNEKPDESEEENSASEPDDSEEENSDVDELSQDDGQQPTEVSKKEGEGTEVKEKRGKGVKGGNVVHPVGEVIDLTLPDDDEDPFLKAVLDPKAPARKEVLDLMGSIRSEAKERVRERCIQLIKLMSHEFAKVKASDQKKKADDTMKEAD